jgi:hypothetical protein
MKDIQSLYGTVRAGGEQALSHTIDEINTSDQVSLKVVDEKKFIAKDKNYEQTFKMQPQSVMLIEIKAI